MSGKSTMSHFRICNNNTCMKEINILTEVFYKVEEGQEKKYYHENCIHVTRFEK